LLFIYKSVPVILQREYWEGLWKISWVYIVILCLDNPYHF
jgi:hypothetical protein